MSYQTLKVVGIGRRYLAYLIDGLMLNFLSCGLGSFLNVASRDLGESPEEVLTFLLVAQGLSFLLGAAYYIFSWWAIGGQTVGKMVTGIKVISKNGEPISFLQAVIRYIGWILSFLVFFLGFAWIAIDESRQGWHDKLAGTYVVPQGTQISPHKDLLFERTESIPSEIFVVLFYVVVILVPVWILVSSGVLSMR